MKIENDDTRTDFIAESKGELIAVLNGLYDHNRRGRLLDKHTGRHVRCSECHTYLTPANFGLITTKGGPICNDLICVSVFDIGQLPEDSLGGKTP